MAVVRQQQFRRGVGQHCTERALNDVDHLGFAFGHVESIGQATLEPLALHLGVADDGLVVRGRDRLGQLGVEALDLRVGESLLALTEDDQYEGERQHDGHQQPDGHQVAR